MMIRIILDFFDYGNFFLFQGRKIYTYLVGELDQILDRKYKRFALDLGPHNHDMVLCTVEPLGGNPAS